MAMPANVARWTRDLVLALPDDGKRYELVDGELLVTPSPGHPHQSALALLFERLSPFIREHGLGRVLWSPADLALGEDEVLQPDLFVVPPELAAGRVEWSDINRLTLVVEVLSPSTARADRTIKRRRFQRAGVPEYWIVDLEGRLIERWRPGDDRPEILVEDLTWQPSGTVSPFHLDLVQFFEEVWG